MSKGAKQTLFILLAVIVVGAVAYTLGSSKNSAGTIPLQPGASGQQGQQQQVDQATLQRIQTLEATVKTNPKDVQSLTELGQLYFNAGQLDKAPATFKAATDADPNNAQLHDYLGFAYFWTGQTADARTEFNKAIQLNPNDADAYYNLALSQSHGEPADIPGAIANWKKVIEVAPNTDLAKKAQDYIDKNQNGNRQTTTAPPIIEGAPKQ